MSEFMTIDSLANYMGIVTATSLLVQFTKSIIKKKFSDVAVRVYTWIISLILIAVFIGFEKNAQGIVLMLINSIIAALTSMGAYEVLADPKAEKKK